MVRDRGRRACARPGDDGDAKCASCHGAGGTSGGIGPALVGVPLAAGLVQAQIDNGSGAMPGGLVDGGDEADVVAYVLSVAAQ